VDEVGKQLAELRIAADPQDFKEAVEMASRYPGVTWGLEGTGASLR